MVAVLVVVTADVDNRVAGVEVPVIAGRHKRAQKLGTAQVAPTAPEFPGADLFFTSRGWGLRPPPPAPPPPLGEFLEAGAEVHARVRGAGVAHTEQAVVAAPVVVTADEDNRVAVLGIAWLAGRVI